MRTAALIAKGLVARGISAMSVDNVIVVPSAGVQVEVMGSHVLYDVLLMTHREYTRRDLDLSMGVDRLCSCVAGDMCGACDPLNMLSAPARAGRTALNSVCSCSN